MPYGMVTDKIRPGFPGDKETLGGDLNSIPFLFPLIYSLLVVTGGYWKSLVTTKPLQHVLPKETPKVPLLGTLERPLQRGILALRLPGTGSRHQASSQEGG